MSKHRNQYVAKCVGGEREANSQEVSKLLESNKDYDLDKIREFSWFYYIPPTERRKWWMILLHLLPEYRENDDRVISSRVQEAELLFNCLKTTRELECQKIRHKNASATSFAAPTIINGIRRTRSTVDGELSDSESIPIDTNEQENTPSHLVSTVKSPSAVDLSNMILLSNGMFHEKHLLRKNYPYYIPLCEQMLILCGSEKWFDAFHLSKRVLKLMTKTFGDEEIMRKTLNEIHDILGKRIGTNTALCERSVFAKLPIRHWLLGAGALIILASRALQRFWDKLLTGEACKTLMVYLVVEFLLIIDKRFGDNILVSCDCRLTEEADMRLVKGVLDQVSKSGGRKSATDIRQKRVHSIL